MYYRRNRFSVYVSRTVLWLRLRDKNGNCGPLYIRVEINTGGN